MLSADRNIRRLHRLISHKKAQKAQNEFSLLTLAPFVLFRGWFVLICIIRVHLWLIPSLESA
jgi:hypothetical protein